MSQLTKEGYQKNIYLEKLGKKTKDYGTNFCDKKDKRWKKWKKQRKKYGFDEREIWNMDVIFVEWIYSHFSMYLQIAAVDLKVNTVSYTDDNGKTKEITQKKAITIILKECRKYLRADFLDNKEKSEIFRSNIMQLLGELMPLMWW